VLVVERMVVQCRLINYPGSWSVVLYESIPELSAKDQFQSGRADPLRKRRTKKINVEDKMTWNLNFFWHYLLFLLYRTYMLDEARYEMRINDDYLTSFNSMHKLIIKRQQRFRRNKSSVMES
jgi:hypothetical protein